MSFIVVSYYTGHQIYYESAEKLLQSLETFGIPHNVEEVKNLGSWNLNTHFKPMFIKQMLQKYSLDSIVYVDVDAVFYKYPSVFNELDKLENVDVAVHVLDHLKEGKKNRPPELLSGTIYLKNNQRTMTIINNWLLECQKNLSLWDQKALANVLKNTEFYRLPDEYCCIFDIMSWVGDPVIKHFQASRISKNGR